MHKYFGLLLLISLHNTSCHANQCVEIFSNFLFLQQNRIITLYPSQLSPALWFDMNVYQAQFSRPNFKNQKLPVFFKTTELENEYLKIRNESVSTSFYVLSGRIEEVFEGEFGIHIERIWKREPRRQISKSRVAQIPTSSIPIQN